MVVPRVDPSELVVGDSDDSSPEELADAPLAAFSSGVIIQAPGDDVTPALDDEDGEKEEGEGVGVHKLHPRFVRQGVAVALTLLHRKAQEGSTAAEQKLHLQFDLKEIPKESQVFQINLPHSPYKQPRKICLIVPDRDDTPFDKTVGFFQLYMKKLDIRHDVHITTRRKLREEIVDSNSKLQFLHCHDLFFTDDKLIKWLETLIGEKALSKCRKNLLPVSLKSPSRLLLALNAVHFKSHVRGTNFAFLIGYHGMTHRQICENVTDAVVQLSRQLPKGWKEVGCLSVLLHNSPIIPLHDVTTAERFQALKRAYQQAPDLTPAPPAAAAHPSRESAAGGGGTDRDARKSDRVKSNEMREKRAKKKKTALEALKTKLKTGIKKNVKNRGSWETDKASNAVESWRQDEENKPCVELSEEALSKRTARQMKKTRCDIHLTQYEQSLFKDRIERKKGPQLSPKFTGLERHMLQNDEYPRKRMKPDDETPDVDIPAELFETDVHLPLPTPKKRMSKAPSRKSTRASLQPETPLRRSARIRSVNA